MVDRTQRELAAEDIDRIADAYRAWRSGVDYADVPGFCKGVALAEIRRHSYILTPGRYVGAEPQADDGEPFEEKMKRLVTQWQAQQTEARRLDTAIDANLKDTRVCRYPGRGEACLARICQINRGLIIHANQYRLSHALHPDPGGSL